MKLDFSIDGAASSIEILSGAPDCHFRIADGKERAASVATPEPGVYSVMLEGRVYEAFVEPGGAGVVVMVGGHRFEVEVRDPRRWSKTARGQGAGGVQNLVAPMPGKVVRVLVAVGDVVEAGQGMVVVEAMKMQNEMKAVRGGKVLSITAKEGATVTAGEVLAAIE